MHDKPVIKYVEAVDRVRDAWGGLFLDVLHKALILDPSAPCVMFGERLHCVVSIDSRWLRLSRMGDRDRVVDVLVPVGHGLSVELQDGILRLFAAHATPGAPTVRQVTL